MTKERLYLFDTTLRDGQQTQGVDFTAEDKVRISHALDDLGLIMLRVAGLGPIRRTVISLMRRQS